MSKFPGKKCSSCGLTWGRAKRACTCGNIFVHKRYLYLMLLFVFDVVVFFFVTVLCH